MKFKLIKASTDTIDTVLPCFPGFYNTALERYTNHQDEVGKIWVDWVNDQIHTFLPSFKYTFQKIYSPSQYNYSNDEVYVSLTYDLEELLNYLSSEKDKFDAYAKDNFTSYDGFISFIPNNYDEYIKEIKNDPHRLDSMIYGGVEFLLVNEYGTALNEEPYWEVMEQVEPDDNWEVDGYYYDNEEDARAEFKYECETNPSEDHVMMYYDGWNDEGEEIEFYKGV